MEDEEERACFLVRVDEVLYPLLEHGLGHDLALAEVVILFCRSVFHSSCPQRE